MRLWLSTVAFAAALTGPTAAHEHRFYFAHDSSELRPEDVAVAEQVATWSRLGGARRLRVVAHADTSGSPDHNVALSQRRAERIAAELVRLGLDRSAMVVEGKGEAEPELQTGDGVREPLNRRGTIEVGF
jgi:OmpA-OmpF porin, OOP family